MRSRHPRLRSFGTVAALAVLGTTVGLSSAGAAVITPIGPGQTFVGQVNGVTVGAVIEVGCFGPVSNTSTGHPISGQTVSVQLLPSGGVTKAGVGYTGTAADHDLVGFGNSSSAAAITQLKAYGQSAEIPATLDLPCSGTGTVGFVPAPTSPTAQTATVDVTFVSIGVTPGS